MLAVFCFNLLGDGLRDLIDPRRTDVSASAPVPLLAVEDLSVEFRTRDGVVRALDRRRASTSSAGETVGVVGRERLGQVGDRARDAGHPRRRRRASPAGARSSAGSIS